MKLGMAGQKHVKFFLAKQEIFIKIPDACCPDGLGGRFYSENF